jgi:hypothetical protein
MAYGNNVYCWLCSTKCEADDKIRTVERSLASSTDLSTYRLSTLNTSVQEVWARSDHLLCDELRNGCNRQTGTSPLQTQSSRQAVSSGGPQAEGWQNTHRETRKRRREAVSGVRPSGGHRFCLYAGRRCVSLGSQGDCRHSRRLPDFASVTASAQFVESTMDV